MLQLPTTSVPIVGNISNGSAMLFLFSPRNIIDHYKRPLTYNFNVELVDSISENILSHPNLNSVRKVLNGTPGISNSIIPSARDGIPVNTSQYSSNWMFLLIVDTNDNTSFSNRLSKRTVSIGMCVDEPISYSGLLSATPEQFINPNCGLCVTRNIEMHNYRTIGPQGDIPRTKTTSSVEITPFDRDLWSNDIFFSLKPNNVIKSVAVDEGEVSAVNIDNSESLNVQQLIRSDSEIASPKKHISKILESFENSASQIAYGSTINDTLANMAEPHVTFEEYMHDSLREYDQLERSEYQKNPMLSNSHMNLGMIKSRYCPVVHVIKTPTCQQGDVIPQHYTSMSIVFSSLVSSTVPLYMNKVGLSGISFMFNSYHQSSQVLLMESMAQESQEELKKKWSAFEFLLRTELYPILKANGGEFDLSVISSLNGTTDVVLNFNDFEPLPIGAVYQENAVLGGITSQLIGTRDHLIQNSLQLNHLVRNVSECVYHSYGNY